MTASRPPVWQWLRGRHHLHPIPLELVDGDRLLEHVAAEPVIASHQEDVVVAGARGLHRLLHDRARERGALAARIAPKVGDGVSARQARVSFS